MLYVRCAPAYICVEALCLYYISTNEKSFGSCCLFIKMNSKCVCTWPRRLSLWTKHVVSKQIGNTTVVDYRVFSFSPRTLSSSCISIFSVILGYRHASVLYIRCTYIVYQYTIYYIVYMSKGRLPRYMCQSIMHAEASTCRTTPQAMGYWLASFSGSENEPNTGMCNSWSAVSRVWHPLR